MWCFFRIILTFPGSVLRVSRMLMELPVSVGTVRLDVSRTLAYCCAVCLSIGRRVGYPVHSLEDQVHLIVPDHSDVSR